MSNNVSIDFRGYRESVEVKRVYTYLHKTQTKKTEYFVKAYEVYLENEGCPEMAAKIVSDILQLQYIAKKYNLTSEQKVKELLETTPFKEKEYKTGKMLLSFKEDDPRHAALFKRLKPLTTQERVFLITQIVNAYWCSGKDEEYIPYQAEELLINLAALYQAANSSKLIDSIVEIISTPLKSEYAPSVLGDVTLMPSQQDVLAALKKSPILENK